MTGRGEQQLLNGHYLCNKNKTGESSNMWKEGNTWKERLAVGVESEILLISTTFFLTKLVNTPILQT